MTKLDKTLRGYEGKCEFKEGGQMKDKKIIIRIVLIILIIINCITIFNFSSQGSEKSSNSSGKVADTIIETLPKTKNLRKDEKEKVKDKITKPIRKTAHFTIYTCLGMLLFLCAKTFETTNQKRIITSWMLGAMYACTDEFHQKFVSGRSSEITDVGIDSLGVAFGIMVVLGAFKIIQCQCRKKAKKD